MKYQVIYDSDMYDWRALESLAEKVEKLCSAGWIPQGGVTIIRAKYSCHAYQAMVKPEN